jgi:flagellar biosynthesis/type III secretory pathway protein FliH
MSETTKTETKPAATKAAPKVETKPAAKKAAPKAKPAAKKAAPKTETKASANSSKFGDIIESQYDATTDTILSALNTLETQIEDAREIGSDKAKDIVSGFGGETKMAELIEKLAGYMGEAAGTGMTVGMAPMMIMAGAAKGVYKKITD